MTSISNLYSLMIVTMMGLCLATSDQLADAQTAPTATLSWNANAERDLAGYRLYRRLGPCPSGPLDGPVRKDVGNVTSYVDTVPSGTTEACYALTAYDRSNNESGQSAKASKVFSSAPPAAPVAPAAPVLTASTITSTSAVISWPSVAGVSVDLRMAPTPMGFGWGSAASVSCPTGTPCMVTGLTPGASVDFQAVAFVPGPSGNVFSALGAPITVKLLPLADTTPPAIPGGLTIASASPDQVVIVASATDCKRVVTSTTGTTRMQLKRTVTCVK